MLNDPKVKAEYERLEPEFRLAYILIEARSRTDLSQEALAERMGMKQATYVAVWELNSQKFFYKIQ